MAKIQDEAANVASETGAVFVDGPAGVAVTLTPRAAIKTAARLIDKAVEAHDDGLIYEETGTAGEADRP